MAKLTLRKSELLRQREQLKAYRSVLPSLDLKRRQLMLESALARQKLARSESALEALLRQVGSELPMLAAIEVDLSPLVRLSSVRLGRQNVAGAHVPTLEQTQFAPTPVSLLASPPWIDALETRLREAATARAEAEVARQRVKILEQAGRKITQRLNLFERVLIPEALQSIRRIQIALNDAERDAVIRSKLSKVRQLAQRQVTERARP